MINQKMKHWIIFALAALGFAHVVYSSLPILDPSSSLFSNDEGYYLKNGSNGVFLAELRYGLFSLLVKAYFLIFREPFWVAILHKSLLLAFFFFLQPRLVREYGGKVFILLYFTFVFLNGFFLRESLVFIFVLLAAYYSYSGRSIGNYASMLGLALTRPQGFMLFLRPWVSLALLLFFLLFMRHLYATAQVNDKGYLSVFHGPFWQYICSTGLTTLANLNPLASLAFYAARGEYLQSALIMLSSIAMFAVFAQMVLALLWGQYRHAYISRLWAGMVGLLTIYAAIGLAADKRIFLSLFAPFIIFVNSSLLRGRNLIFLAAVWILMLMTSMVLKNAA